MSNAKTERLMNLMVLLLVSSRFLTKTDIRNAVEGYQGVSEAAFEKTFERDKEELRRLGVPLQVGPVDAFFSDETGYAIAKDDYELPPIEFTNAEIAIIGVAARAWANNELTANTTAAIHKLCAAGLDVDLNQLQDLQPVVHVDDSVFVDIWRATQDSQQIGFDYQTPGGEPSSRSLQPWRMFAVAGRWYVVGQDLDRQGPRAFRLSRFLGKVTPVGKAGSFQIPDESVIEEAARKLSPEVIQGVAKILAREGAGNGIRRRAEAIDYSVAEDSSGVWDRVLLPFTDPDSLVTELLGYGDRVMLEAPMELREQLIHRLDALLEESRYEQL